MTERESFPFSLFSLTETNEELIKNCCEIVAILDLFPEASVHYLGLFREKVSLQPVEYYRELSSSSFYSTVSRASDGKPGNVTPEFQIFRDSRIADFSLVFVHLSAV